MKTLTAIEMLRDHHLKVTPQRLKIVESLNTYGHLNIDTLYSKVKTDCPNVSLATVYKNIGTMTGNGLLAEVKLPGQKSVFELTKTPHIHLHCTECGKIEDIELQTTQLVEDAQMRSGYHVENADIVLKGKCPACR